VISSALRVERLASGTKGGGKGQSSAFFGKKKAEKEKRVPS
jgi:hypothetical protein